MGDDDWAGNTMVKYFFTFQIPFRDFPPIEVADMIIKGSRPLIPANVQSIICSIIILFIC